METVIGCVVAVGGPDGVSGSLTLTQKASGSSTQPVSVEGVVTGLPKGSYSIAVHEYGDVADNGSRAGQPFSPKGSTVGFLGHLEVDSDGAPLAIAIAKAKITLIGPESVIGRSVLIKDSRTNAVVGCGVVGILNMS